MKSKTFTLNHNYTVGCLPILVGENISISEIWRRPYFTYDIQLSKARHPKPVILHGLREYNPPKMATLISKDLDQEKIVSSHEWIISFQLRIFH